MSETTKPINQGIEAFTFGDTEPALNQTLIDYTFVYQNEKYYEPQISWQGLAKSLRSSPHHSSALALKRNLLTRLLVANKLLNKHEFTGAVMDFLIFGNCFFEMVKNRKGENMQLRRSMAYYTRVAADDNEFYKLPNNSYGTLEYGINYEATPMVKGRVWQLQEADVTQNIYGLPDYLAALQSAWLNEAATLFRRRYYVNGTHAGYILYITDPLHEQVDVDDLRTKIKEAKGPGNFRNLLLYAPGGKKEGIQLIHTAEAAAKDEFLRVKGVSRDDVLAAHRVPPQLIGLVPENSGGFGNAKDAMVVFYELEIVPLLEKFSALNAWAGEEIVVFSRPSWSDFPKP